MPTIGRPKTNASLTTIPKITHDPDTPLVMRATQGRYPPGSTFKTVSAAAAIDTNIATPLSVFTDTNGSVKVTPGGYNHVDCSTCRPASHGPSSR